MSAVQLERRGGTLVATLDRAPVNAIDDELLARLDAALVEAERDESIAVLHLRSAHKVFCAGADLALIRASVATPQGLERMLATVQAMQRVFARLEQLPCLTLAELGGATLGGGFELALACDWRIAAHEARVGLPEAGLGLLAAGGGTQRLTRLLGPGLARRLILGGETLTGEHALQMGLVQWSVPRAALQSAAQALAERAAQVPRYTLAENKRCIALAAAVPGEGYAAEIAATRRLYQNPETRRRVTAFLDKNAAPTKEQA
ncbi:MAG: enoyl-CoA hydratase/isomerase family protein [Piscinibacter sp.]|uniref:enoyl-CoA hydratase/isomerase family protein n=1 Tax=Piscinibacter sp. TaxID=1903157 RepID=UPI001B61553F|nr:enoyl-CoA hydratase/isomerase family protein [Piscinibacter sp.]MBP5990805.1 enoyl-CoA hydratase/isomerase family protein [Piscinibacter sp.]MBP6028215.1 enoyl-CoA hydratase/isomerase family protein [Piscinibacter sp.]